MRRGPQSSAGTSAVCALALLVAACASSAPRTEPPRAEPSQLEPSQIEPAQIEPARTDQPQLSAVAVYGRHAAVRGKVDVRIANHGPEPVEVERYQVQHPLFDPVPALARRSTLPPDGRARIVPVPFGPPRCEAAAAEEAGVLVGVRTGEGVRDVVVPLADGEPGLVRAHRLACAAAEVTAAADLALEPWTLEGEVARTALRLTRRGPGEVVVSRLDGNILFTVDVPAGEPLLVLPESLDAAEVEVTVRASRCEAHAQTESKTSFTFPLFASLDGGEPVLVQLTVARAGRTALQSLLDRTCGPTG